MNDRAWDFTPVSRVEREFFQAYHRVIDGVPRNAELQKKASRRKLKMNLRNVALEANCSRTLISLENCKYPRIRDLVLSHATPRRRKGTIQIGSDQKSKQISDLKIDVKIRDSALAAYVRRLAMASQHIDDQLLSRIRAAEVSSETEAIAETPKGIRSLGGDNVVKITSPE